MTAAGAGSAFLFSLLGVGSRTICFHEADPTDRWVVAVRTDAGQLSIGQRRKVRFVREAFRVHC